MRIKIEAKFRAGIKYDKEAEVYVTYAPALRVSSQGENLIQAKVALKDAVESFLIVAYEKGVLEKCLKNVGFAIDTCPIHKSIKSEEYIEIAEETILVEKQFEDIFDVPVTLPLATRMI